MRMSDRFPMSPEDIRKTNQLFDQPEPIDLTERRYEQVFLARGVPAVEAKKQAEFWAKLKTASPDRVIGPADEIIPAREARIEQNPDTGQMEYHSATPGLRAGLSGAVAQMLSGAPPTILEKPPFFGSNTAIQVDRFALNPGEVYFRALLPGAEFPGPAPEMFATGPLPMITGSGAYPSILRWVPWYVRHSAALAGSRSHLLLIIEETYDGSPDFQKVQSEEGQAQLQAYLSRVSGWANTTPEPPLGNDQIEEFIRSAYPSSPDD